MHRRILASAAAAALTFGLAACGDGGDGPVTTPPPDIGIDAPSDGGGDDPSDGGGSASSDGGGGPTAAAPDIPAPDPADYPGMDQNTPEGAEQATRYFVALMFWGYQTGETTELDKLYTSKCGTCSVNSHNISELDRLGEYWSVSTITDKSITHDTNSENFDVRVGYGMELSPHTEPEPGGGGRIEVSRLIRIQGVVEV